jgi:hypothetical protein
MLGLVAGLPARQLAVARSTARTTAPPRSAGSSAR